MKRILAGLVFSLALLVAAPAMAEAAEVQRGHLPGATLGICYCVAGPGDLIIVDAQKIRALGGERDDIREVLRHERAHARGLMHYEGSPRSNPAFLPYTTID